MDKVHIFRYSIRLSIQKMLTLRAVGVYVILFFYSSFLESPVKEYLTAMGAKISPWLFPHMLSNGSYQLVIAFLSIYFFSDTPFLVKYEANQMARCGRLKWLAAHILSMIETSAAFSIICYMISNIVLFPCLEWSCGWGAAIKTLALTNATDMYGSPVLFSYQLVAGQDPIKITITTLFIVALNSMFLGSIMLTAGLAFNRICSVVFATLIPMWSVIVYNMGYYARQRMSYTAPILWMGVADIGNRTYGMYILPSYKYIFMVLTGGIIGLSILSLFLIKRKDCNFENED